MTLHKEQGITTSSSSIKDTHPSQSTYTVKYLALNARSAIIRSMLHLSNSSYKNEFLTLENVKADRKATPFGHIPVLVEHFPDGTTFELGETLAIQHYLAQKLDYLPSSNPTLSAHLHSLALNLHLSLNTPLFDTSPSLLSNPSTPEGSLFLQETLPRILARQEDYLVQNGNNGHFHGDKTTYPDLVALNWIRVLTQVGMLDLETKDEKGQERPLKKLETVMSQLPEWKGQYEAFHPFRSADTAVDQE